MKLDISIHEIDRALNDGGYYSLRWIVIGPHDESQRFKTKNNAMKYRAIRRRCRNALEALKLYRREVLGKSV